MPCSITMLLLKTWHAFFTCKVILVSLFQLQLGAVQVVRIEAVQPSAPVDILILRKGVVKYRASCRTIFSGMAKLIEVLPLMEVERAKSPSRTSA